MDELEVKEINRLVRPTRGSHDLSVIDSLTQSACRAYERLDTSPRKWGVRELFSRLGPSNRDYTGRLRDMRHFVADTNRTYLDLNRLSWIDFMEVLARFVPYFPGYVVAKFGENRHREDRYVIIINRRLNDGAVL